MFETICYEHWALCFARCAPVFNMFYGSRDDCAWCCLHQVLFNYKPNKRFLGSVHRRIEKLTAQKRTRPRRVFLVSDP